MPAKILIVDDEPDLENIIRQTFRRQIRKNEFEFGFVYNGIEALNYLANDDSVDLVLTDINMPEMDGLSLLQEMSIQHPLCKSVVVSAYGDMPNIRTAMNYGAFDFLTKPIDLKDLEITVRKTLGMVGELKEKLALEKRNRYIRETFGYFMTDEVVKILLDTPGGLKLGGEMREVTILMSDLRGFTSMCEGLPPDQVVLILNRYLEAMVNVIFKYDGTIDEFIGDGILVIFGAPIEHKNHAERAVACALEMQKAMKGFNESNKEEGLPALEMGIGINTGEVIVGNIGSPKRMKYGVVGSHVNLAARIESCTVGGQVLLSDSTYQYAPDLLNIKQKNEIFAKGFKDPISIYDVSSISGQYNIELDQAEDLMSPLKSEIPLSITLLHEKHLSEKVFKGNFIKLSDKGGIIRTDQQIDSLTTIKIDLDAAETKDAGDLFAKVMDSDENDTSAICVRFTAIPAETRNYLQSFRTD